MGGLLPFVSERDAARYFIRPIFSALDCEDEGVIEAGEIGEHFNDVFFRYDRDQSRTITRQEYLFTRDPNAKSKLVYIFDSMDTNSDKVVSPREYHSHIAYSIDSADLNRDGELTEDEAGIESVESKLRKLRAKESNIHAASEIHPVAKQRALKTKHQ